MCIFFLLCNYILGLDILMCLNMYEDSNGFRRELIVYQPLLTKCNVPLLVQKYAKKLKKKIKRKKIKRKIVFFSFIEYSLRRLLEEKTLLDLVPLHQVFTSQINSFFKLHQTNF